MFDVVSKETLDKLSYTSTLGQSLKQISLSKTPLDKILDDIGRYRMTYIDTLISENVIGSRFKSDDSIIRKYHKTINGGGGFKQCFNDILGFRIKLAEYPTVFPEYFRVVDLRKGKRNDDGYRAIHLYYQRDHLAYPIEIQLWCGQDFDFNIWSHKYTYKYKNSEIGLTLLEQYRNGQIQTENDFTNSLKILEDA